MTTKLGGTSLAGMSTTRDRVDNDYYATPPESTLALLEAEDFTGRFLEPCVGGGHIVEAIKSVYGEIPIDYLDIVDRGYEGTRVGDFLELNTMPIYDSIITNPPFSLAQEFLEQSMELLVDGGKVAFFLKVQFLEGIKRKELFEKYPPRTVYVFSARQNPYRNGESTDENGKKWSSTMCFSWFVWEKGFTGTPEIKWL